MSKLLPSFDSMFEIKNFNDDFLLISSKSNSDLANFGRSVFERKFDFVDEVIVTEFEVCIKINHLFSALDMEQLMNVSLDEQAIQRTYQIPVYFSDHEDWEAIEAYTGLKKVKIIPKILESKYTVAMFGFLPGFTYLNGLDKAFHVPRKSVPAKYVEANSLAIGGKYLGIYAIDSPGGWHVIGSIPVSVFDRQSLPPVQFNPGDRLELKAIDLNEFNRIKEKNSSLKAYNV